ncbi:RING-type E3 ubiquitin-protein ligase PPIL2-like [Physella acuta]|uniref:RING-type E3 ubiquitin-protein ligase PPIL2-like n=1 Tax=Physella acuta TaxID=109671 RepID=UPI0027DBD707|nr:RING-type E3 ubiquitin-protein ligase PPIL2-like [Physella acuta]
MGKKQHQKDKLYLTTNEWKHEWGGYKGTQNTGENSKFRRLPYYCCSISLQPFENPLCTNEGVIFDLLNIIPFLKKYGVNPANGEKMSSKDLVRLNFHKNAAGQFHCPVTFKVFNENAHIVAIKPSGNVYSYDAVERLNIKPSHWKDLLTDEPFTRKDIITIQDPTNLDKFNLQSFYHIKKNLRLTEDEEDSKDSKFNLKTINNEAKSTLEELEREYKPSPFLVKKEEEQKKADKFNAAPYSTGKVAASFTSTAMDVHTEFVADLINEDVLRYERVKKKGYVRIVTNLGPLSLELHCDMVPKTCENFLKHCLNGYYKNTIFHRSIRNFMIQGGDPEGTGAGGQSIWGTPFKDELKPNLTHTGRGVLSMANSGPNTNRSQFFITYRSCRHLDGKHAVFGKVVGGLKTLDAMEAIEVDKKDKPKIDIIIEDCVVFSNPYDEADEQLKKEREEDLEKQKREKDEEIKKQKKKTEEPTVKVYKQGVGKYINSTAIKRAATSAEDDTVSDPKQKKKATYNFGNFSSW